MDRLRKFLAHTGMQQQQLAEAAGLSRATISRLVSGVIKDPAVSVAVAIQAATAGKHQVHCEDWVNSK